MKSKIVWLILSCLMVAALVLASCAPTEEEEEEEVIPPTEEEEEEEEVTPPTGDWWDIKWGEPEYGGTITIRVPYNFTQFDPFLESGQPLLPLYASCLMQHNWTLSRDIWPFNITWCPDEFLAGQLVETWTVTEPYQTFVLKIREGIHWQDKPPVNGRELTAYDVEYHFHRLFGIGSGFTEPQCKQFIHPFWKRLESITATDKYTVVFHYSEPALENSQGPGMMSYIGQYRIMPREWVEQGDTTNWRNAVGSGAWILTDFVSGSSATLVKNPDYFRFDERHPENRLPYANKLQVLIIPDMTTALSGLRTAKIDIVEEIPWDTAVQLKKTDPEILQANRIIGCRAIGFNTLKEPFTDVRVRKALQMAINLPEIAETYYGGADQTIYGKGNFLHVSLGWTLPFDEWPEETKEGYTYNPEGARALLEEAGHPTGFQTTCVASSTASDLAQLEIVKAYFEDIGVDMEIVVKDEASANAFINAMQHELNDYSVMATPTGGARDPDSLAAEFTPTGHMKTSGVDDPVYNAMVDELTASFDDAERKSIFKEIDNYCTSHFWWVTTSPLTYNYIAFQPWLKGFMGEGFPRLTWIGYYLEGFWIDQDVKESMGY